jgi:hypothetical protein
VVPHPQRLLHKNVPSNLGLGTVAHACNSSYLGGKDWEDPSLRPAWAKPMRPHLNQQAGCGGCASAIPGM